MVNLPVLDQRRALQSLNQKPPKYLSPDDIHKLLEAWQNDKKYYLLGSLLWQTGLRIDEALGLRAEDIDWNLRQIVVHTLKQRKNDAVRIIPLTAALLPMLSLYVQGNSLKPQDRLFSMSRQAVHEKLKKAVKIALPGKMWVHTHTFRHSFAVNYLKCGGNLVSLKAILGHKRIENTMIYLQLTRPDLHADMERVIF